MDEPITRRGSLARLGALVAAAAGGSALFSEAAEGGNKAVETGAVQCVLTPELTEGPYYIAGEKLRRDIRDGHPAALVVLGLDALAPPVGTAINQQAPVPKPSAGARPLSRLGG